jgi:hypothetical protein
VSSGQTDDRDELQELDRERAMDLLYGLPLSEFTSARNSLVKNQRAQGRDEDARTVAALSKPVLSAWAINQLARRYRSELEDLTEITTTAEDAQDAATLRDAGRARRQTIAHLVGRSKQILEESGHAATPATLERISRTLQASSVGEQRSALLAGRLTRDLEPGGLDFLTAIPEADIVDSDENSDGDERRLILEQMSQRVEEADQRALELTRAAEAAESKARSLAEQAADARREARRIREEAADLTRRAR